MEKLLVVVHTVPTLLSVFDRLGVELLPGVRLVHILDEPLLEWIRQCGHLAPEHSDRLQSHATLAEQIGADAVLVTCSTVSPCVDHLRSRVGIPILKIDEAMVEKAVSTGKRIGVIATNQTTLEPTRQMLQAQANSSEKDIQVQLVLVENALAALMAGDGATHDYQVKQAVLDLMGHVDVVLLAQASMARTLEIIPETERKVPVLSSPLLALSQAKIVLGRVE